MVKERKEGNGGKTDLKYLIKKKKSTHCDCPGRLPGPFPAAPGGFPSFLKHKANNSPKHKLKSPPLQSKRLDWVPDHHVMRLPTRYPSIHQHTPLDGVQGSPSLNFLPPPPSTLAREDDLAAQCPEEENGTLCLRVTLGLCPFSPSSRVSI